MSITQYKRTVLEWANEQGEKLAFDPKWCKKVKTVGQACCPGCNKLPCGPINKNVTV